MKYKIPLPGRYLLFLLFVFSFQITAYGQAGPGGIGNADGSDGEPELVLWLLPDSLSYADGAEVDTWTDYSGNNNDLTGAGSNGKPVYYGDTINGHSAVFFENDISRAVINSFAMPSEAVAVFFVLRTDGTQRLSPLSYAASDADDNEYMFISDYPSSGDFAAFVKGNAYSEAFTYNDNNWKILTHQWRSEDGRMYLHENGSQIYNTNHQSGASINSGGNLSIGAEQDLLDGGYQSADDFEDGEMAEVIMYGSSLKQAQRTVIENYLAQKYGLDASLATDYYVPGDPSYVVSLTGMGRESDGTTEASCDGLVITENGGFDNGEYLLTAHDGAVNTEATINTSSEVTNAGVDSAWNRAWYIDKTTVSGGVNAKIAFDFGEGINGKYPGELSNYKLLYRSNLTSDYSIVTTENTGVQNGDQIYFSVSDAHLNDGYYTLGSTDAATSPLTGVEGQTWYTLKSGDWEDWETWTLDPSGALPDNPANETPAAIDDVVILSGKTVTVNTDSVSAKDLTVKGRLDFQAYSGQSFGTIKGSGRILLSGDNFPAGDASHFVTEGKGEGTVVYYGADNFKLDRILEFYNLEVEMNNTDDTLTLLKDYTINGVFYVNKGTFRINSDTSDNNDLTIDLEGALLVEENGVIITGEADARHQLNIYGDFTNNGTVEFTNRSSADYNNEATNGIVDVNFLNASADQRIYCAGTTNFYRIEIDKGTDDTYELSIESTDPANFNLYGYANQGHGSTAQLTDNDNALGLIRGTVIINNNVNVPVLNNTGNYNISESARLWIDGGYAAKNNGTAIVPYGKIRVSSGTLEARVNSGITTRENGLVKIEGGTLTINQLRTSVFGASNVGGYVQSGGTTNILGGSTNNDYYCFNLTYSGNVFNMSGGTLHIHESEGKGGIFIASDEVNQNVTGGTVIAEISDGENFPITSKAPFWNLIIRNSNSGTGKHILTDGTDVGSTDENLDVQDLHVLNDLTIETGTTRSETAGGESNTYGSYLNLVPDNANPADLYVGKDLTIEDSTVLDVWGWTGSDNSTSATLYFNRSSDAVFNIGDITSYTNALLEYESPNISDGGPDGNFPSAGTGEMHPWKYNLPLYNLIVDKPDGKLSLAANSPGKGGSWGNDPGQAGNWVCSNGGKNTRRWLSQLLSIKNQFKLLNGTFSQMDPYNTVTITENGGGTYGSVGDPVGYSVNFYTTDVEIRDTMFVYESDSTPKEGIIEVRSPNPLTLTTTDDAYIGNMRFIDDHNNPVTLTSDVHFGRIEYFNGTIDIGKYNLKVDLFETYAVDHSLRMDAVASGQPVFEVPNFIRMDGNASDGGLSLKVPKQPTWPLPNNDEFEYLLDSWADEQGPYAFPDRLWFPIGTDASGSDKYTPAVCRLHDYGTTDGDEYITVRVVDQELQTTDLTGGDILSYYWNVDFEGYAAGEEPTVSWIFQYDDADLDVGGGDETQFVPGKVLDGGDYTRSDEGGINAVKDGGLGTIEGNILGSDPANIIIFNGTGSSGSTDPDDDIESISSTMFDTDASGPNINTNWQNAWPNTGFTLENANYTAGESNRFVGSPEIYYSVRNSGWGGYNWDDNNSWYDGPNSTTHPADYPTAGDIAVIRGNNGQDGININGNQEAAEVIMQREGTYTDIEDLQRLRFAPTDELTAGKISGVGDLYLQRNTSSSPVVDADIGEFAANDTSVVHFYMTQDGTYNVSEADFFTVMPTLRIYGQNSDYNRIASFNYDFECTKMVVDGEARLRVGGNYTVDSLTRLGFTGHGGIEFPNGTEAYTFSTGDFVTGRGKNQAGNDYEITVASGGGNGIEHVFEVRDSILLDFTDDGGTLYWDFYTNATDNNVILRLADTGNHAFVDGYDPANSTIDFYKIEMNKGTDTTSTFTFKDDFTLNGPTSGAGVDKALKLQNGKLILDDPNINMDLTTGDDDFNIAGSSALEIKQGQANASGNSGILLDGGIILRGGTLDMSGGDNYIEYSVSGNASIDISGGTLIVGSQIRRGLTSTEGILNYTQTDGTVVVGNNTAPEDNRGVLEILNTGSSFNFTGGDLYMARAQDNPSTASLYLDPETHNWADSSKLHIGYNNTPANEVMSIYSRIPAHKLVVDSSSNNSFTLRQWTVPLKVNDTLEIQSNTTFDANGQDLTLNGDLIVDGTFTPNNNITYISGSSLQEITGSPVFWNLIKDQNNTLRLNDEITVNNELRLNNGTIDDNGKTLHAKGNVWMDATHIHGSGGDGIEFDGTEAQELQSNGGTITFGKLSINNPGGTDSVAVSVPEGNIITIEDTLQMEMGIFDVGKNLVVLEKNAEIKEKSSFSSNNMIQTNISFTDAGIKKYFPEITSNTSFTYPIGSKGKYTPVEFFISSKDAGGFIRVKAADEIHPTIINDTEPCDQIHDTSNVLKYHWIIEANGITNFSADVHMKYYEEDIQIDNSLSTTSYDTTSYIAARLLLGSLQWNKYGPNTFNETDQQIEISFTGTDDQGISGEYTAGIEDQDGSCEGAIPDEVPVYISTTNGDWSDETIWDTYPEGGGTVPGGGPKGSAVIIEHEVTISKNYIVGYKTTIDTGGVDTSGILKLGQTFGHRLGIVDGKGTLQLERGDLPAGVYDDFLSADGGTLEYTGTDNYDVLGEITSLNNLKFSGTGERRFPNLDLLLYGYLEIAGDNSTLEVINEHDKNLNIQGDITFTDGSFDAGNGSNAEIIMDGSSLQTITGSFEGFNAFNDLTLQNSSGLEIMDSIEVDETFTLTSGMVYVPDTGLVTLNNTNSGALSGAGASRYIQGPLSKKIQNGSDYTFEIGDTSRYGKLKLLNTSPTSAQYWEVQYYNNNPDNHTVLDTSSYEPTLERISGNEYWRINGVPTAKAQNQIRWDEYSILPAETDDRSNNLKMVEWITANARWEIVDPATVVDNGVNSGTITSDNQLTLEDNHYFTFGSTETVPLASAGFETQDTSLCEGEAINLVIGNSGDPDIIITINKDGNPYDTITVANPGDTTITIATNAILSDAGTYSIDSVGDANGEGNIYGESVSVTVNSLPLDYTFVGGDTSICSTDSVELLLENSETDVNYELLENLGATGITVGGTGDTISFGYFNKVGSNSYTVDAVNQNTGCTRSLSASKTISVTQSPDPEPTAVYGSVCYADGATVDTLDANDIEGVGDSYTWSPDSVLTFNTTGDTAYYQPTWNPNSVSVERWFKVTVTEPNLGCQGVDSVNVELFRKPETGNQYYIPNDFDQ